MQRLILRSGQCPGDVVVMTAAVRELHRQYPNQYQTDVRTCAPAIWQYNPYITPIADDDREARSIQMHYPLINQSNQRPVHFLEGYCDYLAGQLGLPSLRPHVFRGEIHLSEEERCWMSQVEETTGYCGPFWLVNAGSKNDFTCKQWPFDSFQAVIDHFQGRLTFVQIGAAEHNHRALRGVIDLLGKTDHRQFIRLIYHAAGVLTGVSYPMHLAAAVPMRGVDSVGNALRGVPRTAAGDVENALPRSRKERDGLGIPARRDSHCLRPCVVINGGREPAHWEQYPGHQFLHTIGALDCCATGGCWKSRVAPLGDGDPKDRDLCSQPVASHPRCMRLITPDDVIRAIERYMECGDSSPLSLVAERPSAEIASSALPRANSVGSALRGVPLAAPRQKKAAMNRTPSKKVLIDFRHGLGDAVQLTTLLLHLRHYHPEWQIDVACGIGKLPGEGSGFRVQGSGSVTGVGSAMERLYHRLFIRGRDRLDRAAYKHVFELSWDECPTCYADSPSTKAEYCLRTVFKLEPIPELCRYELSVGDEAMAKAGAYLASICAPASDLAASKGNRPRTTDRHRYPVVLLHYQANTSTDKKNLPHDLARRVCETAIEAGFVPVILDWDKRSPLPDGTRIFNPGADHPLWGGIGTGDTEVLAALIAQSSLFIGVDSGPLHVAGALSVGNALRGVPPGNALRGVPPGNALRGVPPAAGQLEPGTGQEPRKDRSAASESGDESHALQEGATPVIAIWTGHHPLHYFALADHVTHLVPEDHASRLRGDRAIGQAFFEANYRRHVYRQLAVDLPALVASLLSGESLEQARNKQFLRTLRATGYDEIYYLEHQCAGLDYLTFGEWQRQYGRWLVESLTLPGKRVLDVGCACGSILRGLAAAGSAGEGVDLCEAMICRGRQAWPEMASRLHVCDAVNLHIFGDGVFDAVHSSQAAEHWKPELVPFILRELARVTVRGGLLFCALDTTELFARQGRRMECEDPTHVCIRPLSWWHERLAEAGWQVCTADYEGRLREHPESFLTRYDWDWFIARREGSGPRVPRRENEA